MVSRYVRAYCAYYYYYQLLYSGPFFSIDVRFHFMCYIVVFFFFVFSIIISIFNILTCPAAPQGRDFCLAVSGPWFQQNIRTLSNDNGLLLLAKHLHGISERYSVLFFGTYGAGPLKDRMDGFD